MESIHNYDETGYGDKPENLNRFLYWASHVSNNVLDRTVATIRDR